MGADHRTLWWCAVVLIIVGATARVGWAAWIAHVEPAAVRSPDTPGYLEPARALIDTGRFSLSPMDNAPMFVRTPGYPAFLAPILWITNSEWAISPIQATVSVLGVVLVVLVGWRLIGPTAGLVAGLLLLLDPLQLAASGTILTESIASVVMAALVAVGAVVFASRSPRHVPAVAVFGLGALVALGTMVRPAMWLYPLVLLPLLAVRFRDLQWRAVLGRIIVFAVPVVAVVGGWQVRNQSAVDSWQLSGVSGIVFYCANAAEVEARTAGISFDAARERLGCPISYNNPNGACTRTTGFGCQMPDPDASGQGFDEWNRQGLDVMADHPVQTARVLVEGLVREVAGPGSGTVRRYLDADASIALTGALFLWNAALWTFAALGAVAGIRSKHRVFWLFVITTIAYVLAVSAGAGAYARYRTPLIPLLGLLAALGVQSAVRRLRSGRPHSMQALGRRAATSGATAR